MASPEVELLVELQQVDDEIDRLEEGLRERPELYAAREREAQSASDRVSDLEEKLKKLKATLANTETELQAKEEQAKKYTVQRNQANTNEEYAAFTKEIETAKGEASDLETRILELYEEIEATETELEKARATEEDEADRLSELEAALSEEMDDLEGRLAASRGQRQELVEEIDAQTLAAYDRIRERTGGQALARMEDETCQGCHVALRSNLVVKVLEGTEGFQTCPSCSRILFHD